MRSTCVLLVDECHDDRALVRRQLHETPANDCIVEEVDDGYGALAALDRAPVDLVLLDDDLPGLSALELIGEIRARLGRTAPPIILLTLRDDDEFTVRALRAGVTDLLPKRLADGATLRRVLRHALEHRRLRDELRESEELFRGLAEGSPAFVFRTDAAGRVIYGNARWTEMTGQSLEDMCAGRWIEAVHPDDRARFEVLALAENERQDWAGELRIIGREGQTRWLRIKAKALRDGTGRFLGWVGSVDDVTDRMRAEIALRESEARLAAALEAGRCIAWEWRADTNHIERSANAPALCGLAVSEPAEIDALLERVHPVEREGLRRAAELAAATGGSYLCEYRFTCEDGSVRWLADQARMLVDESGALRGAAGIVRDVTAERAATAERERLLDLAQRARTTAEEASRHKDHFLAMVSHELRSPLNVMTGWIEALERLGDDRAHRTRALEVLRRAVRAQTAVVNDLFDASAIATGRLHVERQAIDLGPLVAQAIAAHEPEAGRRRIKLSQRRAGGALPVEGDPERLTQMLHALVDNAVKFTEDGGEVEVATLASNGQALVAVRDTGIGIVPDFLPQLFAGFRQASAGTTRRYGGLGLGLRIARRVAELHGGTVTAHSAGAGRGSTFVVHLPLGATAAPPAPRAEAAADPGPVPTVLLVEDEPDSREVFRLALSMAGIETQAAGSVGEAAVLLDHFVPDVVVTDLGMPGEDGYQLLRRVRLRDAESGRHTPVVAVTGRATAEDERTAYAAGFDAHLGKPIEPATLHVTVTRLWRTLGGGAGPRSPR